MSVFTRPPWSDLEHLSSQDIQIIKRYLSNPKSTSFLGASEILRKRGLHQQSIVVLEDGLKYYPHYHAARALLARAYLSQGLFHESYDLVQRVVQESPENLLARKLELKLATLFEDRSVVLKSLKTLKRLASDDPLTKSIRGCVALEDWKQGRYVVRRHFLEMGLVLPDDLEQSITHSPSTTVPEAPMPTFGEWSIQLVEKNPDYVLSEKTQSQFNHDALPDAFHFGQGLNYLRGEKERYLALSGFSRLPIQEAIQHQKQIEKTKSTLGEKTLADFYYDEGHFLKALNLYTKLVREHPHDSCLIRKHQEILEKLKNQDPKEAISTQQNVVAKELKLKKLKYLLNRIDS